MARERPATKKKAEALPTWDHQARAQGPGLGGQRPLTPGARPKLPLLLFVLKGELNTVTKQETQPHIASRASATATCMASCHGQEPRTAPEEQVPALPGTALQSRGPAPAATLGGSPGRRALHELQSPQTNCWDQSHSHRRATWMRSRAALCLTAGKLRCRRGTGRGKQAPFPSIPPSPSLQGTSM